MTPEEFIEKWKLSTLKERSASQSHFNDLCELLEVPKPTDVDPDGSWFTFERGAKKSGGGDGWADVWKKGCFGWEYKGKKKNLDEALRQLQQYALALDNPPLLIVSDMDRIIIHTNFTNTISEIHSINIDDLINADARNKLKAAFTDPNILKPSKTRDAITADAAKPFAELAQRLRERDYESMRVAHFINKLLFCMFAEDIGVLQQQLFTDLLKNAVSKHEHFVNTLKALFSAMSKGGYFGVTYIPLFNGGLFNDEDVIPLKLEEIKIVLEAAELDWSNIEPAIFGTLFERGLDPSKRSQLGAHYTDRLSIMRIIEPIIEVPLLNEWSDIKVSIEEYLTKQQTAKSPSAATKAHKNAVALYYGFLERLRKFRILDPACGSGNFLYLALITIKNIEHLVCLEAEAMGLQKAWPMVSPEVIYGIEINPFAAELARVTVWIGEIQWMLNHGYAVSENPILKPLDNIQCCDALMNEEGLEIEWPNSDVIIGNPPFLGNKKMISELGEDYVKKLRKLYAGRLSGSVDLVMYWFEKSLTYLEAGHVKGVGLVSTNSIRAGSNRKILEGILDIGTIYNAWSDEPWVVEGAAVRVSIVCFGLDNSSKIIKLNNKEVTTIRSDLTGDEDGTSSDMTLAKKLIENTGIAFQGPVKAGAFDITGDLARQFLKLPNPHGKSNHEVLRPWINGAGITRRNTDKWIIDDVSTDTPLLIKLFNADEFDFKLAEEYAATKMKHGNKAKEIGIPEDIQFELLTLIEPENKQRRKTVLNQVRRMRTKLNSKARSASSRLNEKDILYITTQFYCLKLANSSPKIAARYLKSMPVQPRSNSNSINEHMRKRKVWFETHMGVRDW
jgi:type II restriction/modification system DNA methylase subunit YeeA